MSVENITQAYALAETPATPEQLDSILWLFRYARNQKIPGHAAVGKLFTPPRDASAISKLFGAKYGAELTNICEDIEKLRAITAQNAEVDGEPLIRLPWICTDTVDAVFRDKRSAGILSQIGNRGVLRRRIPTKPARVDVEAIIDAYRLQPPKKGSQAARIVDEICDESGLGKLCKYLQVARFLAVNKQQVFSWSHFIETHGNIQAWALGNEEEGR